MTKRELLNFNKELRPQGKKCCTTCNEVKPLKEFVTGGKLKSGEMNYKLCRVCNSKRGIQFNKENPNANKEWREKNKEHVEKQRILYYQKNREHLLTQKKIYREENKELINKRDNKRYKERMLNDLMYCIKEKIRKNIYHKIKNKKFSTCDILGCDYETFKEYIENQFQEGMTFENHGQFGWHYDHIIPSSSADTEEELYKLNHYTNFQPLWWDDNLSKGPKLGWSKELQINN